MSASRNALGLVLALTSGVSASTGPEPNPHVWNSTVTSVAVFKDGHGFFMREGEVELRDGWCASGPVPPATFGTFAVYSHDATEAVDIVGNGPGEVVGFDGVDAPDTEQARRERLEAWVGLSIELTYRYRRDTRSAVGTVLSVESRDVILEDDENRYAIPIESVTRMQVLDLPLRVHVQDEIGDSAAGTTTLGMAYLRGGITWIPEYTLRVIDDETAELTLRGTLVNEAEDIIHGDVHFVVGVPHFVHADKLSPIAIGQVIRTIGTAVAPARLREQILSRGAIASNAQVAAQEFDPGGPRSVVEKPVGAGGSDLQAATGGTPAMPGAAEMDYTTYTKHDLTVRRGEKAIVTLFTARVRYSHVYRWPVPGRIEHRLVLHNDTGSAWTTGPALAVSGPHPLGEDLIRYTPKDGQCEFPVTAAVNIAHDRTEQETDRRLRHHAPRHGVHLDLVTIGGVLKLRNFEPDAVRVLVEVPTAGRPVHASHDGATSTDASNLKLLERSGTIRWKVDLEPGASVILEYGYERFVPSS